MGWCQFFFIIIAVICKSEKYFAEPPVNGKQNTHFFPQDVSVFLEVCLKSAASYSLCDDTVNLAEIVKPFLNSSSSAPRLILVICCSWKVVSITNKHTHTDQLLDSRWPEPSGHRTLIVADNLPLVALDDFFWGGCMSAHAAMSRQQTLKSWGREECEEGGAKWGEAIKAKQTKKIYENAKKFETAFFNGYLLSHKPRWEIHCSAKQKQPLCKQYG